MHHSNYRLLGCYKVWIEDLRLGIPLYQPRALDTLRAGPLTIIIIYYYKLLLSSSFLLLLFLLPMLT